MKSRIFRVLAVCLVIFSSLILSAQGPALAKSTFLGKDSSQSATAISGNGTGSAESQRQTASKLEIPTGGELGREDVRDTIESANTRSAHEMRDQALEILPTPPKGEYSADSVGQTRGMQ